MTINGDQNDSGMSELGFSFGIRKCYGAKGLIVFWVILSICVNCRVSMGAGNRSVSTGAPVMPVQRKKRKEKSHLTKMVLQEGEYEPAIERVWKQFGRPHWKRAGRLVTDMRDYMYALRMMSELMVYVDKKEVFDLYMPKLLRVRQRILNYQFNPETSVIPARGVKKIRQSSDYKKALEGYRYAQKAYEATPADMKHLMQVPENIDEQLADIFFDEVATFKSNDAAVKAARAVIDGMEKYDDLSEKYKYAFARGELIKRWLEEHGNDLRARDLALPVWEKAQKVIYREEKELSKKNREKFNELWRTISRARTWRGASYKKSKGDQKTMRPASPQVKRRLKALLGRVSNAFEKSDAESLKSLLHPQGIRQKRGLSELVEADISTYKYMNFNKFRISTDGKRATVECELKITIDSAGGLAEQDDVGTKIEKVKIRFSKDGGKWLIQKLH